MHFSKVNAGTLRLALIQDSRNHAPNAKRLIAEQTLTFHSSDPERHVDIKGGGADAAPRSLHYHWQPGR